MGLFLYVVLCASLREISGAIPYEMQKARLPVRGQLVA